MGKLFVVRKKGSGHTEGTLVLQYRVKDTGIGKHKYLGNWIGSAVGFWEGQSVLQRVPCTKENLRKHRRSILKCPNFQAAVK